VRVAWARHIFFSHHSIYFVGKQERAFQFQKHITITSPPPTSQVNKSSTMPHSHSYLALAALSLLFFSKEARGFVGPQKPKNEWILCSESFVSAPVETELSVKDQLVDLLPRMTGSEDEFRKVETFVNTLEESYQPVQTLSFLNLAMEGDWQLLFSTNYLVAKGSQTNPNMFRLRKLVQRIECNGLEGSLANQATWDLAQQQENENNENERVGFGSCSGTFTVKCTYQINQGSRMLMDVQDHVLEPFRGSDIPQDVQSLVGLLHRAMPKELFDPSEHAMDTTYLDGNLRIVRYTGPRLEGVRDIFIRQGSLQVDPSKL
jgi:hypothetical protein